MTTAKASPTKKAAAAKPAAPSPSTAPAVGPGSPSLDKTKAEPGASKPVNIKDLPVRDGEEPWVKAELDAVRAALQEDIARFQSQIEISTAELEGLLRDGSEGAGRDPADVGSANFERRTELSLANNAREMLDQSELALRHIEMGTFGNCDECGKPIGKGRLQAFPRATLCVTCKQREERR